jgi:hypothetical protein
MPLKSALLAAALFVFWLASFLWIDGPARLMAQVRDIAAAIIHAKPAWTFINEVLIPGHPVKLTCEGSLINDFRSNEGPATYKVAIDMTRKTMEFGSYPARPIDEMDAGHVSTATSFTHEGVSLAVLDRDTGHIWAHFYDPRSLYFTGTCKRVDPLF